MANRRVLIVDDSPPFLQYLSLVLSRREGIEVAGAVATAAAGRECAADRDIDIALLDWSVLAADGNRTIADLRALRPGIRVALISGFDAEECRIAAAAVGADGYLSKMDFSAGLIPLLEGL